MTGIHVMLDLETASAEPNAAIIAIGAVAFAGRKAYSDQFFYSKNSLASAESLGLNVSRATMEWWNKPEHFHARAEAFSGQEDLQTTLAEFMQWCKTLGPLAEIRIWGNGAAFDPVILKSAYETHTDYPFDFRLHRCYRTVNSLFNHFIPNVPFAGTRHSAIDDAKHQAQRISHLVSDGRIVLS